MNRKFLIITIALALIVACASPALAATATAASTLDTASHMQIEIAKDNDVSAAMLSKLLGTEWQSIAGSKAADMLDGLGKFAGVFTLFLSILNAIAMLFVAVLVLYEWGIHAVTVAHQGKDGNFNNLWVPVRQAFSFSLVVPVTSGGLSLLQAAIIGAVSLSINFANVVWDEVGGYLLSHVQTGVVDNVPPFVDEESMALIGPMFKSVVAQEVAIAMGNKLPEVPVQAYPEKPGYFSKYQSVSAAHGGKYTIVREPLEGRISVYLTAPFRRSPLGDLGGVLIPYPVKKGDTEDKDDKAQFDAMRKVAEARATAVVEMWESLRVWADYYLHDEKANPNRIFVDQQRPRPEGDGLTVARKYRDHVMSISESNLALLRSQLGVEKMLKKAIDSDGTESKLGWVSAGLMPFSFAQAQKRLDDLSFGGGAVFINAAGDYTVHSAGAIGNKAIGYAPAWANEELLQGRVYQPISEEGDAPNAVNRLIAGLFLGQGNGVLDNQGILSGTLQKFRQADPMVVISDFGRKFYEFASTLAGITLGAAGLSWLPLVGDALAAIATSPAMAGAMYVGFALAVCLFFLPPIAVLSAWIWALLKWALTIVYTLTGAPLWAIAHCAPEGQGFSGDHARQGYYILLDLLLRPALMTGGVVVSMAVWQVAADLYSTLLAKYLNGFTSFNGSGIIAELIFSAVVFLIFMAIYLKIFTFCINQGPSLVMDLFGRRGASSLEASDHDGQHITAAAGLATAKGGQMLGNMASGIQDGTAGAKSMYGKVRGKLDAMQGSEGTVSGGSMGSMAAKE